MWLRSFLEVARQLAFSFGIGNIGYLYSQRPNASKKLRRKTTETTSRATCGALSAIDFAARNVESERFEPKSGDAPWPMAFNETNASNDGKEWWRTGKSTCIASTKTHTHTHTYIYIYLNPAKIRRGTTWHEPMHRKMIRLRSNGNKS